MPSDYDQIRNDNIEEYGRGERHLAYLGSLYPDRTHFVFEILQNAEDAGASKVRFTVSQDKLEVTHDGRPFTDRDVRGLCGIGEGEKADDLTKIGRFGIGFKSVYAYTMRPEIHSGDDHFCIEKYVRPCAVEPRPIYDSWTTLFVFPFDKTEPDPNVASEEISDCLGKLNIRTLLFLKSIKEVEYAIPGATGVYLREDSARGSAREVEIVGQSNEDEETEKWLVFSRPVKTPEMSQNIYVELGFFLATDNDGKQTIERVQDTPLVVYFPTEKRTDLGFLIQGPYQTTLARDNVPTSEPWNEVLINETADLTVESLHELKKLGLLTVSLLNTLPIDADDFPSWSMFRPIYTRVKEALIKEELLPTHDSSFVAAKNALLARGVDLMNLLNNAGSLGTLWESDGNIRWLPSSAITENRTPNLRRYLIEELNVEEVTPESFAAKVTASFMDDQSDEWVQDFYCFLRGHRSLWIQRSYSFRDTSGVLLNKSILRLQDGSHVIPFSGREPNAYLSNGTDTATSLPIVKVELTQRDDARKFLRELGIPEFDLVEEIMMTVLPKYTTGINISLDENQNDLQKIEWAMIRGSDEKQQRLIRQLTVTPFILCTVPATETQEYRKADSIYFRSDELGGYFEGNRSFAYVDRDHAQRALFEKLGIADSVRIARKPWDSRGYVKIDRRWGFHRRGRERFDPNIYVDGLEQALADPTVEKSAFIWSKIVIPYFDCIRGIVESSGRQNYVDSKQEKLTSNFGDLLIETEWLPDSSGEMHKPCDLRLDDLHHAFERHHRVAEQLAMKADADAELCERAGVSQQELDRLRRIKEAPQEVQQRIDRMLDADDREGPEFPQEESSNTERRRQRIQRHYSVAPPKSYEKHVRTVRTTEDSIDQHTQLRQWYTNESEQMVCQICKDEMPFKKRDGEYYFEAVEVLSKDYLPRELESQYLALCPLCAAKYKEFVKRDDQAMTEVCQALTEMEKESDSLEVPLTFGESSASVRFVQTHVIDLQAILNAGQP